MSKQFKTVLSHALKNIVEKFIETLDKTKMIETSDRGCSVGSSQVFL